MRRKPSTMRGLEQERDDETFAPEIVNVLWGKAHHCDISGEQRRIRLGGESSLKII